MKVLFPNPYGFALPDEPSVRALQRKHGFSDGYAMFLLTQNGLEIDRLADDDRRSRYLVATGEEPPEQSSDLRALYGLKSGSRYYELTDQFENFIFIEQFFPIGVSYGGDEYVEILAGKSKGRIVSLDHEYYASSRTLADFVQTFQLKGFFEADNDRRCDMLMNDGVGVAWVHAPSIAEFLDGGVRCGEDSSGYVRDALSG